MLSRLRTPADLAGAARREAYFRDHGWVATTMEMGTPGHVEFVVDRELFAGEPARLALGLMPERDPAAVRGWPAGVDDGCADPALVGGEVPEELRFEPRAWLELASQEASPAPRP